MLSISWKVPCFMVIQETKLVALSNAEAEYISAGNCCAQLLWMKQTLLDYGITSKNIPLLCDNESAVKLATKSVQHSRTKHIDIRHCWRLVLKCYELRTRQHKMLNINALHPPKHYLHKDLMNFGRRSRA
jgi:hypothetical protein